jgi:hypothetical protein
VGLIAPISYVLKEVWVNMEDWNGKEMSIISYSCGEVYRQTCDIGPVVQILLSGS